MTLSDKARENTKSLPDFLKGPVPEGMKTATGEEFENRRKADELIKWIGDQFDEATEDLMEIIKDVLESHNLT